MCGLLPFACGGRCAARSPPALEGPRPPTGGIRSDERLCALVACWLLSALPLLVASGRAADDHHAAVATDDAALVADRLDAWLDLHRTRSWLVQRQPVKAIGAVGLTCSGRRCVRGSGRRARAPRPPGPRAGCGCSAGASCR